VFIQAYRIRGWRCCCYCCWTAICVVIMKWTPKKNDWYKSFMKTVEYPLWHRRLIAWRRTVDKLRFVPQSGEVKSPVIRCDSIVSHRLINLQPTGQLYLFVIAFILCVFVCFFLFSFCVVSASFANKHPHLSRWKIGELKSKSKFI